jgi:hypothetical protein
MKKLLYVLVLLIPLSIACADTTCPIKLPSLRDYFAAQALNGMDESQGLIVYGDTRIARLPVLAYRFADAMMKARQMSPYAINQKLRELIPQIVKKSK